MTKRTAAIVGAIFGLVLGALLVVPTVAGATSISSKGGSGGVGGVGTSNSCSAGSNFGCRHIMRYAIASQASTAWDDTATSLANYGAGTKAILSTGSTRLLQHNHSAAAGAVTGALSAAFLTRGDFSPKLSGFIRWRSITNQVSWVALDNNGGACGPGVGAGQATPNPSVACASNQMVGVFQDSRNGLGVDRPLCCSGDGTTTSCVLFPLNPVIDATNTSDLNIVVYFEGHVPRLTCTYGAQVVVKTTNLPASTTDLKINVGGMTTVVTPALGPSMGSLTLEVPW